MKLPASILSCVLAIGLQVARAQTPSSETYVRVVYEDSTVRYFNYFDCYPYEVNGSIAVLAEWLQSSTCYNYQFPNCTGLVFPPVGVPVPKGARLVNAADFVQVIGQAAICLRNALPGLPL